MSVLSAGTGSCGGDGDRFGLGGEMAVEGEVVALVMAFPFAFPLALRKMGASLSTSLTGADDSDEVSEMSIVAWCKRVLGVAT